MKELKIHEILIFVPFRNERKKGKPKMKRFKTKRKRKYPDKYSKPKRIWTEEDCRKGWERLFSEGRPCQKNGARAPYAKFGYNVTKNMAPKKNTSSPIQTSEPKVRSIREIGENGRKKETTNKENVPWWIPFIIGITLFRADILIVPVMTIFISILAGIVLIDILFQIVNKSLFGLQKGTNKCIQRPVKISVPILKGYAEGVWSATGKWCCKSRRKIGLCASDSEGNMAKNGRTDTDDEKPYTTMDSSERLYTHYIWDSGANGHCVGEKEGKVFLNNIKKASGKFTGMTGNSTSYEYEGERRTELPIGYTKSNKKEEVKFERVSILKKNDRHDLISHVQFHKDNPEHSIVTNGSGAFLVRTEDLNRISKVQVGELGEEDGFYHELEQYEYKPAF